MILVKAPQVSFSNEIMELARVFFPEEHVTILGDEENLSPEDMVLESLYKSEELGFVSFYACLRRGTGLKHMQEDLQGGQARLWEHRVNCRESRLKNAAGYHTAKPDSHRFIKNGMKGCVYDLLSSFTGKQPKWGILTGIRPVKIVHELLDSGYSYEEIRRELQEVYRMHPSKMELAMKTAEVQRPLLANQDSRTVSVYIHIPFCATRCLYCSFPTDLIRRVSGKMGSYLDCLEQELAAVMQEFQKQGITADTIYIGGGTPTVLNHADLERLLSMVRDLVGSQFNIAEYTVEAGRPDSLDMKKLQLLREYGVTRLSINPQSMNQETLDLIGRSHSVDDIIEAYHQTRNIGFDSINMDVILGLPGETAEHMKRTMEGIAALKPDNITIHTLAVKRASGLKESFNQYDPSRQGLAEEMADVCREWIEKLNMVPYYLYRQKYMLDHLENVGYSIPGKECLYNIHIMEEKRSIWAFGAGAASKIYYPAEDRVERIANVKNLDEYIGRIGEMIEKKLKVLRRQEIE